MRHLPTAATTASGLSAISEGRVSHLFLRPPSPVSSPHPPSLRYGAGYFGVASEQSGDGRRGHAGARFSAGGRSSGQSCRTTFQTRGERFSLSWRRVALLGIAQRQIRIKYAQKSRKSKRSKPLPTSIQTLGDLIQAKRHEKNLTSGHLALKMGIATALVRSWEDGTSQPDNQQLAVLAKLLEFGGEVDPTKFPLFQGSS